MKETVLENYMQLKTEVYESIIPKSIDMRYCQKQTGLEEGI